MGDYKMGNKRGVKYQFDYTLLIIIFILSIMGLVMVYSASNVVALEEYNDSFYYFKRQGFFLILSYICLYFILKY